MRRVVATGFGVLSPVGNSVKEFWDSLVKGKSGIGPITKFDASNFKTRIAGELKDFNPEPIIEKRDARRIDLFSQYGICAVAEAVQQSALSFENEDLYRIGVIFGSGIGGINILEQQVETFLTKGPSRISPFYITGMITDMVAGLIAIKYGIKGPNYVTTSACASGAHAIGSAYSAIARGEADCMITGGSEGSITPTSIAGFININALSRRNDEPEKASRPFDRDRDGFVMGEGSGILILEELDYARKRGARIYGEIFGYGLSGEAFHMTALEESGKNVVRCIKNCLKEGNIGLDQVDYLNAHGTSTPLNDIVESVAIRTCFGEYADKLNVSSTKSMHGHCLGAAGAIEAVATILAVKNDIIPPTINLENQDEKCDLNYTPNISVAKEVNVALSNSMGFGGHNVTLGFKKYIS